MRIGIDLGGSKTEGIVMGHGGEILHRLRRPTPATRGYDAVLGNIADLVDELEQLAG
ncbi:MAG: ROK family protein, partial [Gammaproteobacteria bacterium]|nr:ROK family protein [Gammaproteobacteria bacterium]